ncbi:hypothetical protein M501DRAFT_213872 [Patellaria atrata CBS 101060]|uniref:Uncharacterized protein n=1 Tax=Patellaria atrata CBS 101060 TaxID=1346257 RepID=A0A9P4VQZ9_9PEZI|nr:hypothetical protein M501DRAFT_213872 [Patellaria atrata CBS 101060]
MSSTEVVRKRGRPKKAIATSNADAQQQEVPEMKAEVAPKKKGRKPKVPSIEEVQEKAEEVFKLVKATSTSKRGKGKAMEQESVVEASSPSTSKRKGPVKAIESTGIPTPERSEPSKEALMIPQSQSRILQALVASKRSQDPQKLRLRSPPLSPQTPPIVRNARNCSDQSLKSTTIPPQPAPPSACAAALSPTPFSIPHPLPSLSLSSTPALLAKSTAQFANTKSTSSPSPSKTPPLPTTTQKTPQPPLKPYSPKSPQQPPVPPEKLAPKLPSLGEVNRIAVSQQSKRPLRPGTEEYKAAYKSATRKWTGLVVALPIVAVTSYVLYERCKFIPPALHFYVCGRT